MTDEQIHQAAAAMAAAVVGRAVVQPQSAAEKYFQFLEALERADKNREQTR